MPANMCFYNILFTWQSLFKASNYDFNSNESFVFYDNFVLRDAPCGLNFEGVFWGGMLRHNRECCVTFAIVVSAFYNW